MHRDTYMYHMHIHTRTKPVAITHLVEWIADLINVFNLHVWQSFAVFSVHDVLVKTELKLFVRIGLFHRRLDFFNVQKYS